MAEATSMAQLEKLLMLEMKKAMDEASVKIKTDMDKHIAEFYSEGSPTIYKRTGKMRNAPKTTNTSIGGNSVEFDAYLEPQQYVVPNNDFTDRGYSSYFNGSQVLEAAEAGVAHILGKPGFWGNSLKDMEKDLNDSMSKHFT